ncbi:hypothetical protein CFC21_032445 [Triticum aestivum]|uniref:Uncharacterized protein n=1 Tax=Triticum aestivum TaxID=4565 RepID=A0A9R1JJ21_WHEAT|nr:hypothetical protein CFC21_032445 [Triticum aestivum]
MSTATATTLASYPVARPRGRRTVRPPACAFHPEVARAVESLQAEFREVDRALALNSYRVSAAFRAARVAPHHFGGSTGYGHDDAGGREALDSVFAHVVGAEAAIVRPQFFSGTHAIACALFALLRPGHELLAVAGPPYDTLEEVIGIRGSDNVGSLKDFGITYREVPLAADGGLDWDALAHAVRPETGCALIQRSCGYSWRKSLGIDDIRRTIDLVKAVELGNRERLIAFCEVVQQTCPVGSFIKPTAGETPGYASEVIFADGTFMDGSTSELSCDGPLRDPYAVFCQGGTHWTQWALVLGEILKVI